MVKTRSQTLAIKVKEEEDSKNELKHALHSDSKGNASKNKNKRTERNAPKTRRLSLVKLKEENDFKLLLHTPKIGPHKKSQPTTKHQIELLIASISIDKTSVRAASKKLNIPQAEGYKYYNIFMNDPERKFPSPIESSRNKTENITQEQINKLIRYISINKMSIKGASKLAGISYHSGWRYYKLCLSKQDNQVSSPVASTKLSGALCTQEQINKLFAYILDENISLAAAAIKANLSHSTAYRYYTQYLNDPHRQIPTPKKRVGFTPTKEEITKLIEYVNNRNLSVPKAAKELNMTVTTAYRYYKLYKDHSHQEIPEQIGKHRLHERVKNLLSLIENNHLSVTNAARKACLCIQTAAKYYKQSKENAQNNNITCNPPLED